MIFVALVKALLWRDAESAAAKVVLAALPSALPTPKRCSQAWERDAAPVNIPTRGSELVPYLNRLRAASCGPFTPGTPIWVSGKWPGVAWSLEHCNRGVEAALVLGQPVGPTKTILVRYYGEHTTAWVPIARCFPAEGLEQDEGRLAALAAWCTKTGKYVLRTRTRNRDASGLAGDMPDATIVYSASS